MKTAVFSTKPYDREFIDKANHSFDHEIHYFEAKLSQETVSLAHGFPCVSGFVSDTFDAAVLRELAEEGTELIALRSAGFNNVDLEVAEEAGLCIVRVPAYSPHAVAEHTIGLLLCLNRKIHRSYARVREGNLSLNGLLGFDLHGKVVGVIGTGKIGTNVVRILDGLGLKVLAFDPYPNETARELATYVEVDELISQSDIISLHCPLTPESHHLINSEAIEQMKEGVVLLNTSRGALIDTVAVIDGLKSGKISSLGIDVYEEEGDLFFEDLSNQVIKDDVFARLLTFPNVLVTGHQAFFTREALSSIAKTTLQNISDFEAKQECPNKVTLEAVKGSS